MGKYIKSFFATIVVSVIIYMSGQTVFGGGNHLETEILSVGSIIVLLLSYLIAQVHYLIDLIKSK
ncbi:hypothetical protein ACGTN9_11310 [Halobacillus sp. MO56]